MVTGRPTRATRQPHREPRAHWLLLCLSMLVLLGELCLDGYATRQAAGDMPESGTGRRPTSAGETDRGPGVATPGGNPTVRGPAGRPTAAEPRPGPVLRVAADGSVTGRAMPARTIALTFDDGPDPVWTPRILTVLARHHIQATFFQLGTRVNQYPEISRQIVAGGSEVGSHGFTHAAPNGDRQRGMELTLAGNAIAAATGRRPVLLRPPSPPAASAAGQPWRESAPAGYLTVLSDLDTGDQHRPGVAKIMAAAWPAPGAGAVVLMHDAGGDRSQTVAALELLIPRLRAAGYRFVTVSQALGLAGAPAAAATQRWRGHALRFAQSAGAWLSDALIAFMMITVFVGILRLAVQLSGSLLHHRRGRDRRGHGPDRQLRTPDQQLRTPDRRGRERERRRLPRPGWDRDRHRDGEPPTQPGLVSVIVPAYNEAANIAATIRSILANDHPDVEVIVVDDGSIDATAGIVTDLGLPRVTLVRQANAGKAAALNNGVRHARGDILVFVDGDTVLQPDTVSRLVRPLANHRIGAVSGYPKVANRAGLLGRWQHLEYAVGFNLDRRMLDMFGCMPTIPGAIGAFRREALRDAGGVSTQTLAEDTDLTMTIIRAGWRVAYEPAAIAWTEAPSTVRQLWRQRYRWSYGTLQVLWKHRHALVERGEAGRLGRLCLPYLLTFQILLPLCAPAVDIYGLYGMVTQPFGTVAAGWLGFTIIQMLTTGYTLRLDREGYGPLWAAPLQQVLYRQLNYLVVTQALVMALTGARLRWHRMHRTGAAAAYADAVRAQAASA